MRGSLIIYARTISTALVGCAGGAPPDQSAPSYSTNGRSRDDFPSVNSAASRQSWATTIGHCAWAV